MIKIIPSSLLCMIMIYNIVGRVFANGPGDWGFDPRLSHTKDSKNGT